MSTEIIHAIVLIIAIGITFIFPKSNFAQYDLQISALLFIFLYLSKKFAVAKNSSSRLIESVVFTLVVLGIVNTTGGTESPYFFLIYFLLFSISMLLEPIISITTTASLVIFYFMGLPQGQSIKTLLPIFSLAFLTPFAMFMGQEYMQVKKLEVKSEKLEEDSLLFISLILKNYIKTIREAVENYVGDHELQIIKKCAQKMEQLIEKYEKQN